VVIRVFGWHSAFFCAVLFDLIKNDKKKQQLFLNNRGLPESSCYSLEPNTEMGHVGRGGVQVC